MKKSNKVLIGSLAIAMIGVFTVSSVMAYQGDYSNRGPAYSPERHSAMEKAMSNNDYEAWSKLMADRGRITQIINKDNFAQFAKAHELAHNGDSEKADTIRQELGLRTRDGKKVGAKYRRKQEGEQRNEKMNSENRGQNQNGRFIDINNDGNCDNL